ncbi:MAG: hypothetical protein FJ086_09885 [Deltaproteobacteria bacterium]|nr:hypothetical protein [Deltaproteobacteria bacterium]
MRVRAIPVASAALLGAFAAVVAARAGLAFPGFQSLFVKVTWGGVAYCAIGCLANPATPNRRERAIWLPFGLCMPALSATVALSAAPG